MTLRPLRLLALAASLALVSALLLGCGSSGDGSSPSPSVSAAANDVMMRAIAEGQFEGVGMKPVTAVIVKSKDVKGGYYVAMKFTSSSGEQVGVWATKFLDASSMIWAVDEVAEKTTQWPITSSSDEEHFSMDDAGAQEAADALK